MRRSVESADASIDASAEARRDTLLNNLAELVRDYVQLRGVQADIAITRDNIATGRNVLRLTQSRANSGLTPVLDVTTARAQVSAIEAGLPQLEQQEAMLINALGTLLGQQPGALRDELSAAAPVPPVPPRGADRGAVGTRPAAARYPPGRGSVARRHGGYRRRGRRFLPEGDAVRQRRPAVVAAEEPVLPRRRPIRVRAQRDRADFRRRQTEMRRWNCARRSSGKPPSSIRKSFSRRCRKSTTRSAPTPTNSAGTTGWRRRCATARRRCNCPPALRPRPGGFSESA